MLAPNQLCRCLRMAIENHKSEIGNPVAIVTGGSRGIGRGICVELARNGYVVAINYAGNEEAARETQHQIESLGRDPEKDTLLCRADVGIASDRERLVDEVLARWSRID